VGTTQLGQDEKSIQRFSSKKWQAHLRLEGLDGTIMLQMNLK